MSKTGTVIGWAAALLASTQLAMAADPIDQGYDFNNWYLSATGGLNQIFDTDLDADGDSEDGEIEFDYGARGGVALGYYWDEHWRSELEFAYSSTGVDEFSPKGGGGGVSLDGSLDIFSVLAKIDYEMLFFGWWRPYIGVGVGAAVVSADDIGEKGSKFPLDGNDTVFAGAIEAGSKFIVSDQVEIFSQSQLLIMSDVDIGFSGTSSEGTLDSPLAWSSSIGLRLRF